MPRDKPCPEMREAARALSRKSERAPSAKEDSIHLDDVVRMHMQSARECSCKADEASHDSDVVAASARYLSPVAILDAIDRNDAQLLSLNWLLKHAANAGAHLPRRQDLPEAACVSVKQMREWVEGAPPHVTSKVLPLIAISYCWLSPENPDPTGEQLQAVATVLAGERSAYAEFFPDMAVFWVGRTPSPTPALRPSPHPIPTTLPAPPPPPPARLRCLSVPCVHRVTTEPCVLTTVALTLNVHARVHRIGPPCSSTTAALRAPRRSTPPSSGLCMRRWTCGTRTVAPLSSS